MPCLHMILGIHRLDKRVSGKPLTFRHLSPPRTRQSRSFSLGVGKHNDLGKGTKSSLCCGPGGAPRPRTQGCPRGGSRSDRHQESARPEFSHPSRPPSPCRSPTLTRYTHTHTPVFQISIHPLFEDTHIQSRRKLLTACMISQRHSCGTAKAVKAWRVFDGTNTLLTQLNTIWLQRPLGWECEPTRSQLVNFTLRKSFL